MAVNLKLSILYHRFSYYMKIRDVQTLALLSCVLSKQQLPNSLALSPVKAKKGYTIGSNNYPEVSYVSIHQALLFSIPKMFFAEGTMVRHESDVM